MSEPCGSCGQPLEQGELFCEACGAQRGASAAAGKVMPAQASAAAPTPPAVAPVPVPAGVCPTCGAAADQITADGYCGQCGMKQPAPTDHHELDLGSCAAVSDRGHRHRDNEDAFALATEGGVSTVVVCDGVSHSSSPAAASAAAAAAALQALAPALQMETDAERRVALLRTAVADAQSAVAALAGPGDAQTPATTIVAAIIGPGSMTVASVGDSRAYWLGSAEQGGQALTVDDSAAEEQIAAGVPAEQAYAGPDAHAITGWLGSDAGEVRPNLVTAEIPHPGRVVVCSDGLWNYFMGAPELIALVEAGEDRSAISVARRMVTAALDAGGQDNVTVAVIPAVPVPVPSKPEETFADVDVHA